MRSQTAALDAATLGEGTKTEAAPAEADSAAVRQMLKRAVDGPVAPDILDDRPKGGSDSDAGWLDPLP